MSVNSSVVNIAAIKPAKIPAKRVENTGVRFRPTVIRKVFGNNPAIIWRRIQIKGKTINMKN